MMRLLLIGVFCLSLSACSSRDYHVGMLNETSVNTRQAYHIKQIQRYDRQAVASSNDRVCYTYPPALGGFTTGCQDRRRNY